MQTWVAIRYSQARTLSPSKDLSPSPGAQVGLLHGVLGVVVRREHAVAVHVQLAAVPLEGVLQVLVVVHGLLPVAGRLSGRGA